MKIYFSFLEKAWVYLFTGVGEYTPQIIYFLNEQKAIQNGFYGNTPILPS